MNPKQLRDSISEQCGFKSEHHCPNCNVLISSGKNLCHACDIERDFGDMRAISTDEETTLTPRIISEPSKPNKAKAQQGEPTSFSQWLEQNQDSIEPLDRTEATVQWFDNKAKDENTFE